MPSTFNEAEAYNTVLRTFNGFSNADKPSVVVEINFGSYDYDGDIAYEGDISYGTAIAALDPNPSWEDVSSYVTAASVKRGNDNYLNRQIEAGSAQITLSDPDSRFVPSNTSSPYSPYVKPGRPVRISADWSDARTEIFRGMTQRWTQNFGRNRGSTEVVLTCVDTMALLELYEIDQTLVGSNGDTSHARISTILSDTGPFASREPWPTLLRDIDTSTTALVEQDAAETVPVLDAIKTVVDSEWGLFFISKDGKATYKGRTAANPGSGASPEPDYYFGDSESTTVTLEVDYEFSSLSYASEVDYDAETITLTGVAQGRYDTFEVESDDGNLSNLVVVETAYGVESGWQYEESIREYEERRLRITTLLATASEAEDLAKFVLNNQYDPLLRARRVGFYQGTSLAATQAAITAELLDVVQIRHNAPGSFLVELSALVFGIEHEIADEQWYTTFIFGSQYGVDGAGVIGSAL